MKTPFSVHLSHVKQPALIKMSAGVVLLGLFAFLFVRSLHDTRTEPYTVPPQHLRTWSLALEPASNPNDPVLVLRPAAELASGLFKQIFARSMESLTTPTAPALSVVLKSEFDHDVGDQMPEDALVAAARAAGVESAPTPRCLVQRRVSVPGRTRQVYFVSFDAPAIVQFRRQLGLDSEALSPIVFVAGADADFNSWLPLRVSETDCLAPIDIGD